MNTLVRLWTEAEERAPGKTAVITPNKRLTYRQLGEQIRRLAAALAGQWQVQPGDVVALLSPNCSEFIVAYFAIVHLGATVQPIDERLSTEEIKLILQDSGAGALIVHEGLWAKFKAIWKDLPGVTRILGIGVAGETAVADFNSFIAANTLPLPEYQARPDDIAELMYTSGTTNYPKGVMRSHANVWAAARNSIRGFGYCESDIIAIVMPMSHSSALNSQMMPMIQLSGTLVLLERFEVEPLLEIIQREGATCMRAVPAMMRLLLASPLFSAQHLPSLRILINSSGPIDPTTFTEIKQRFAAIQVMNSYGLTEASTCTVLPDAMALTRPDSIGHAIAGVEMIVLDETGQPMADNNVGEIAIRGEHVFVGYRNRPEEYAAAFSNGWLRTRDLAHRDSEGYYYLHGRSDDVINTGGHKYSPLEVENCILQIMDVADVAVVAAPHAILGQVGKAYVVPRAGVTLEARQVIQHCTRVLPSYKIPFFVEIADAIPKNSVGKTLRRKLKETT